VKEQQCAVVTLIGIARHLIDLSCMEGSQATLAKTKTNEFGDKWIHVGPGSRKSLKWLVHQLFSRKGANMFRWRNFPVNLGFDHHIYMLGGYDDYRSSCQCGSPNNLFTNDRYSTLLIGDNIHDGIINHVRAALDPSSLFVYVSSKLHIARSSAQT